MERLISLSELHELDAAIAESQQRPVLLFKHSRYCGVSCEALDELHAHIERSAGHTIYKSLRSRPIGRSRTRQPSDSVSAMKRRKHCC